MGTLRSTHFTLRPGLSTEAWSASRCIPYTTYYFKQL